ncbi:MAG: hypothetical protein CL564_02800 [Alphaproteobacteria bacterium]|nr:hypothetical protein [Alphaproteobacteria bacterium]|tara:strand:+ start:193 stop:648 length:456 start_codon:yes stop_codon:yes gene_type:complete
MFKIIKLLAISYIILLSSNISYANNLDCKNKENDIACNYIISIQKNNASDLGTYNININIIKIKEISGIFSSDMSINAGLCSEPLETVVKEKIQIAQALKNQSYNFPLYLHKKEIVTDFCVELLVNNCIDTCGDVIRLEAILSPIMQMQQR